MHKRYLLLLAGDVILAIAGFAAGFGLRLGTARIEELAPQITGLELLLFLLAVLFSTFFVELYNPDRHPGWRETVVRVVFGLSISFGLLSAGYYLVPGGRVGRGVLLLALGSFGLLQLLWHLTFTLLINSHGFVQKVLVLGTGPLAQQIGNIITSTNHQHVLCGYLNCANDPVTVPSGTIVGDRNALLDVVGREQPQKIVVSLSERRGTLPVREMLSCKLSGIEVIDAPSFYEQLTGKLLLENLKPSWLIFNQGCRITRLVKLQKRVSDLILAAVGLVVAAPFLPLIALAIKLDSPGPVFFRQNRVGEHEKPFQLVKFRTMRSDAEQATGAVWAQKNDCRITRIGGILRKTRIDELPQLLNVLRGDMSFIGPRPERPEFVKPGITGWAQIRYPYGASVEDAIEKLRFDLFYIKHLSPFLDFLIVLETIKVVLFGRGGR